MISSLVCRAFPLNLQLNRERETLMPTLGHQSTMYGFSQGFQSAQLVCRGLARLTIAFVAACCVTSCFLVKSGPAILLVADRSAGVEALRVDGGALPVDHPEIDLGTHFTIGVHKMEVKLDGHWKEGWPEVLGEDKWTITPDSVISSRYRKSWPLKERKGHA